MIDVKVNRRHRELIVRIFGEDPNEQGDSSAEEFARQQTWLETGVETRDLEPDDAEIFQHITKAVEMLARFEQTVREEQLLLDYKASKSVSARES